MSPHVVYAVKLGPFKAMWAKYTIPQSLSQFIHRLRAVLEEFILLEHAFKMIGHWAFKSAVLRFFDVDNCQLPSGYSQFHVLGGEYTSFFLQWVNGFSLVNGFS
jgi:hypothetical protein